MAIEDKSRDETLLCNINRQAEKRSGLSSGKNTTLQKYYLLIKGEW